MPRWLHLPESHERPLLGTFIQTPEPMIIDYLGRIGFDLLCLEAEHSPIAPTQTGVMAASADQAGVPLLVRVMGNDPNLISQALDGGAAGVIVPRIKTADEARTAVAAARYPPTGQRGVGPGRASVYGLNLQNYVSEATDNTFVGIQIESRSAVDALDEILSVPGVDLIFVGPADLAMSYREAAKTVRLSYQPDARDSESIDIDFVIEDILRRTTAAGTMAGIFAPSAEDAWRWIEKGFRFLLAGSDLMLMAAGGRSILEDLGSRAASAEQRS